MSGITKSNSAQLSPAEIRRRARQWFDRQIEIIALAHGPSWPEHREWIEEYLVAEIRARLLELGWRDRE
ncbi:hypothetical protein [Ottowia sp. VDI28]|uniref:hypothetical protein n=1 Tax=Ottowia sp. VDI28 TaxID=3133968 RepID=UPI003C2C669B